MTKRLNDVYYFSLCLLFCKHRSREISVTAVGKKNNNVLALILGSLCYLCGSPKSSARTDTYESTLLSRKCRAEFKCSLVRDCDNFVIYLRIKSIRHKACADTLNLMCAALACCQNGRSFGFKSDNLNIGILLLKILADARYCSARTYTCDENIYLALKVSINLGACGLIMCLWVYGIFKLTCDD